MTKSQLINSLKADIGKTAAQLDIFNKLGIAADNWCVDYGQLKFEQFGIRKYLYDTKARDVGAVFEAFWAKKRILTREQEPKVGDIMITTNHPGSRSWRTDVYGFYMPELDHFTIITDLSKNDKAHGYIIGAIGGNQGSDDIYSAEVGYREYPFEKQAVYCSVDWDAIEQGGAKMLDTIDVSYNQGTIDWAKVKKAGIKNVLIRIGEGDLKSQYDPMFEKNYKAAKAQGLKIGGYYVSQCGNDPVYEDYTQDAKLEAKICLDLIKGKAFDFPIYHDLEVKSVQTKKIQAATMAFCAAIEAGGYKAGVYASNDFFDAYLDYKAIKSKYSIWLAQWEVSKPSKDCDIWQYSESGSCSGITTTVDYDKMYTTFGPRKVLANVKIQLAGGDYLPRLGVTLDVYRILKSCGYDVGSKPTEKDPWPKQLSEAVKAYQKKFKLKENGILDEATAISIFSLEKG